MRIGIDVRYLSHGLVGGVHTYVAHFVPELIDLARGHQFFLYADSKRPFELKDLPSHVTVRLLPWRNPLWSVANDFLMWRQMAEDNLDVVHFPTNYGFGPSRARTVITLHDEFNILPLPEIVRGAAYGWGKRRPRTLAMLTYLHYCTRLALTRASLLLTVSDYARQRIARHSNVSQERIWIAPNAPAPGVRRIEDPAVLAEVRQRHRLGRPFVLADALKNPAALAEAWRLLPPEIRDGKQIVFFSRRLDLLPIVQEAVARGEATLLLRPSTEDLVALYSSAEAFVFPSFFEGFGLPPLEAMTCGAPVIASNRGSIPEVVGDAALLADATDAPGFARHLALVLGDRDAAQDLREKGFARAAEFSWRRSAQRILESYEVVGKK